MDWGFNHSILSPGDYDSILKGCYKGGIMRIQSGKAIGSLTLIHKEESLN